jgi:hypothetical protein
VQIEFPFQGVWNVAWYLAAIRMPQSGMSLKSCGGCSARRFFFVISRVLL